MKKSGLLCLLVLSAGAQAADHGFYAGAGVSSVDASYAASRRVVGLAADSGLPEGVIDTADLEPLGSSAWRVMGGYRVLDWLAIEGNFSKYDGNSRSTRLVCVTTPCPAREAGDADSSSLSALAIYPRGPLDFFVKAGLTHWRADLAFYEPDGSRLQTSRKDGTNLGFGAGAQLRHSRVLLRLEFERVKFGVDEANLVTLGVGCAF